MSSIELYGGPLDGHVLELNDPVPEHVTFGSNQGFEDYCKVMSGEYILPWFVYDHLAGYQRWLHS